MGEAKRRLNWVPREGRGLIVSNPIEVDDDGIYMKHGSLDVQEIRFSLLFWDRLVWPSSPVLQFGEGDEDASFLEKADILTRPVYIPSKDEMDITQLLTDTYIQAFIDFEAKEPGRWLLRRERVHSC